MGKNNRTEVAAQRYHKQWPSIKSNYASALRPEFAGESAARFLEQVDKIEDLNEAIDHANRNGNDIEKLTEESFFQELGTTREELERLKRHHHLIAAGQNFDRIKDASFDMVPTYLERTIGYLKKSGLDLSEGFNRATGIEMAAGFEIASTRASLHGKPSMYTQKVDAILRSLDIR